MIYAAAAVGYLLGSIPVGLLVGWLAGKDVRHEGSGNIGFTNVLRVCGLAWGLPVLLLDLAKGFAPAFWIAPALVDRSGTFAAVLAGLAAILGHNFPVWLRFRGGKGVATSAGAVLALMPEAFGVALVTWAGMVGLTRYVSVGSMSAGVALLIAHLVLSPTPFGGNDLPLTVLAVVLCGLVVVRHKGNIQRLRAGTENRIGASAIRGNEDVASQAPEGKRDA